MSLTKKNPVVILALLCGAIFRPAFAMVMAQNKPCRFDAEILQFAGTPAEQARCLLRPNRRGGVLGAALNKLPAPLEKIIGRPFLVAKTSLRHYLAAGRINEADLGGSLDEPLVKAKLPDRAEIEAVYFVIHDTSSPYLRGAPFPAAFDVDENSPANLLGIWSGRPVAHVFINRLGNSLTTTPFSEAVRQGFGTKFARDNLKTSAKGLQLHIELVQPRRRDAADPNPDNDLIAPEPGFTEKQYARLALLYVAASARRGTWLIPAYHAAIDAGIAGAHDDPQNFGLKKFAAAVNKLIKRID